MALHFSRDTKVYLESANTGSPSIQSVWEIPVLDGFSLSQATNSSEITLNEAGTTSRRASLVFNDSLAPVEWSFTTYARPFLAPGGVDYATSHVHAVEEALWAMFIGATGFDGDDVWSAAVGTPVVYTGTTLTTFNFNSSNISNMPETYALYFSFSDGAATENVYKITKAVINSATMDFDIDGLAQITWSGFGSLMQDQQGVSPQRPTVTHNEGVTETGAFIRNRVSDVTLQRTDVSPNETYSIVLTGGSITLENNLTYLVPEELGLVNQPLGNVTGARSFSGTITAYLDTEPSPSKSAELLADLVADTTTVRNVFDMSIDIGGTGANPSISFDLPTAHLEIPNPTIEDVVSVEINFRAQVSGGNVDNTDEMTIIYRAN